MKLKLLLSTILFICHFNLWAQSTAGEGYLDTTFNQSGAVPGRMQLDSLKGTLGAIAVDPIGRTVAVSYDLKNIYINRMKYDGTYDPNFGVMGFRKITSPDTHSVYCVAIQPDGKILIGGARNKSGWDMFLLRLNANGSLDNTFDSDGYWIYNFGGNDQIDKIYVQGDKKIVIAGKRLIGTNPIGITVARLNPDASFDINFSTGIGFMNINSSIKSVGGLELDKDNRVYVAGDSNSYFRIVKLLPSGEYDNTFGSSGLAKNGIYNGILIGLAIQDDGKILVAGNYSSYTFKALRFRKDGGIDSTFGINGTAEHSINYSTMTGIFLQKSERIILTGSSYYYGYTLMKLENSGSLDSTFGGNGVLNSSGDPVISVSVLSPDGKIILFGKESAGFAVYRMFSSSPIHINGSSYVLPNSSETYTVQIPSVWNGYTFTWSYSGQNVYTLNTGDTKATTLFFSDSASSGILKCTLSVGGVTMIEKKYIIINRSATDAYQLEELQCPKRLTDCSVGYMDYFKLNLIRNDSSGCSSNGYSDFTKSNMVDTLAVGGVYSAVLKVDVPNTYVGIWIDYNNDGYFNTSDEFVAEKFSGSATYIEIPNIILKNEGGYSGPKRMRVRCSPDTVLTAGDACQEAGQKGETEDYLVVLVLQDELAAPQIITPNDDGKNDYFVIRGVNPDSDNQLSIFDRWGQEKFSAENYENNWNGTSKGEKLLPGTYYYLFTNNGKAIRGFLEIRY